MKISDLKNYTVVNPGNGQVSSQSNKSKSLGKKVLDMASGISNFVGAKGITDQYGASLARANLPFADKLGIPKLNEQAKSMVENPSLKNVIGSAIQTGSLLIPGLGEGGLASKIAADVATGYGLDVGSKLQNNKSIGQSLTPGIGTATGAALPVVGAAIRPATAIVGRMLKGLGSGISGVSTKTLDAIINNPEVAAEATKRLESSGNNKILEDNAKTIVNGIGKVRQDARNAFGAGLEKLSATDVKPDIFRKETQQILDKYGIGMQNGQRVFNGVEFTDPKNIAKASDLIDKLSNTNLDGKSLRKLSDDIENSAYKTATSDERLSFNSFVRDLSHSVKDAISNSTGKLGEINQKFSTDMQLTHAMQNIFGKVNFKNLPEVVKASQKLEGLFSQKGLAPDVVDSFLKKIGINPNDFRTSEAVRQISDKTSGANAQGITMGEILRETSSAIVTPKTIRNLSIATGLAKEKIGPILKAMKPAARNILIEALIGSNQDNSDQVPQ